MEYRNRVALYSDANWKYFGDARTSYAIMGNIPYPIDTSVFSETELTSDLRAILNGGVHITFKIGDLEFAASREALQYTAHTKKAILDSINEISKYLVTEVSKNQLI